MLNYEIYLNLFRDYLKLKGYSERTVDSYNSNSKRFFEFICNHYPRIASIEQINKDVIYDYQNYLKGHKNKKGQSFSNTTHNSILIALRQLFAFLVRKDYLLKNPARDIVLAKVEQRLTRKILTEEEVLSLIDSIKPVDAVSIRNRAIVELFYACGIRTSELCNLKINDVDFKEQTVTIEGKGNKTRTAPIGQYSCYYIDLYLKKSRKYMLNGKKNDPGNLFLSSRGNPFNKNTINKTVIASVVKRFNVNKKMSCYIFRHSVASHLLANKVDLMNIAKLLGHASLRTTQVYLHVDISDLKKMHSLCHPRERV